MTGRRKVLFICLTASIVLAVAVVVVVISLQLLPEIQRPEQVVPSSVGRFHPKLGWALKPGARAVSHATGEPVEYTINSKGLRDAETDYRKPEGIFRIVLLGDSHTFGYGVPIERHFSRILENEFRDLQVVNMGVCGYGVDQDLLLLRMEGFRYEPDLVLTYVPHFAGNRHMHTYRFGGGKPRFRLGADSELHLQNSPVGTVPVRADPRAQLPDEENLKDPVFQKELLELGQAIVGAMNREAGEHGAGFLLITMYGPLTDWAREEKLNVLDVRPVMSNPGLALPRGLAHMNEAGNQALAREIATYLREHRLVPEHHWKIQPGR